MILPLVTDRPSFPPLLRGEPAASGQDPFDKAVSDALIGTDPGLVVWAPETHRLAAALVLTPETALGPALTVSFAVALGLGDALGALAPPEVAVHYDWPGGFRVNGAACGGMRAAASTADPGTEPDWLVIGIEMPFTAPATASSDDQPGSRPEETALHLEGCGDVTPPALLESWARHTLHWIHRWQEEGLAGLHPHWTKRAWGIGETLPDGGLYMGLDEDGGRLVKTAAGTRVDPLTELLEAS